ncbi:uncharacterized protein si:dkey-261h17.1 [Melanotaenia boesemani]|uniref:uncharacterized protein si:dkey-261h17.1 n=1 Tax=Melanotaenia boesemani TaxID=1250792 RepID=UPI001C03D8AC|nr:uncharacterized protein si:dkey-261h17.1 [Melanotaenia boesemani]XP_041860987.1 uncharacterized protein si:dkey-261h17.1 [Melanotaenia boesemani]
MAASMWRMNGLCRSMAGVVLLCALLFSAEVMCQDNATVVPDASKTSEPAAIPADGASGTVPDSGQSALATDSPADNASPQVTGHQAVDDIQVDVSTAAPAAASDDKTVPAEVQDGVFVVKEVFPVVKCVEKEAISKSSALKAVVSTDDCDGTKRIIQENPVAWCQIENCNIEIFQEGNMMLMSSNDAKLSTLVEMLQSEHLKDKLGVKTETPSSSSSSVFVGILITGLLAAAAIVVGYFKCQRRPDTKGAKLAEDDIENQGNTLASVAPLNPPPETQEKPSVNGESPEADKTQTPPPPTNGHSTTKTADTEL